MFRIAAEFQDVPLGDAQVLQEPPGAVRHKRDGTAAKGRWNVGHSFIEIQVSAATFEEIEEVFAKGLVRIGSHGKVSVVFDVIPLNAKRVLWNAATAP
jgi:hypothetical protein